MTNDQVLARAALCGLAWTGALSGAEMPDLADAADYREADDAAVSALCRAILDGAVSGPEAVGPEPLLRRLAALALQTVEGAAEAGGVLRELIHRDGRRQRELARLAGIPEASLSLYAAGKRRPGRGSAARLARVLGCEPEDLR